MSYETYRYLWPPRPEVKAPPTLINFYAHRGWHGQVKKNGTCTVIFARGDEVIFKTRHDDDHKAWTPTADHVAFFTGRERWNVYVAELLHSKGPSVRNHLYLFDIIVSDGTELVGSTFAERQSILEQRFPADPGPCVGGLGAIRVSPFFSRAQSYRSGFAQVWNSLGALDEGIVFKNPNGKLSPCVSQLSNGGWQVKVRRPHSNYSF